MDVRTVGVIGAGTMGNGIAHVFARSGFLVVLCDVEQRFLERGLATITKNLDREVAKNKITAEEKAAALKRIEAVTERAKLADCDSSWRRRRRSLKSRRRFFATSTGWRGRRSFWPRILLRSRLPSLRR